MNRKLYSIIAALLIAVLSTSSVLAGGNIKLSASVSSGSPLQLVGTLTGLGGYSEGVTVTLTGFGTVLSVTCTNPQGRQAPGQNPGRITVGGFQEVGFDDIDTKGRAEVNFSAGEPVLPGACPNGKWTASFVVAWETAEVFVYDNRYPFLADNWLLKQVYQPCTPNIPGDPTSGYTCPLFSNESGH